MPRSLASRVVLAVGAVALATLLAVGGTLFVVLRGLYLEATHLSLSTAAVPLAAGLRTRPAALDELRDLASEVGELSVFVLGSDGRVTTLVGSRPPAAGFPLPAGGRGTVETGLATFPDGERYAYAVAAVRRPGLPLGPRAIVLATPDRSAALALRDLARTLPVVGLVLLVVGAPIAWLLGRSVGGPLRRLALATSDVPAARADPLPLAGPAEVQELTERFNAMIAELADARRREAELLANLRHDLRTPVTVIGGFAAALADGTARGEDARRAARAIAEEAARLAALTEELAALDRLRLGAAGLQLSPVAPGEVLRSALERFTGQAAAVGAELVIAGDPDGLPSLVADRLALDRIVANLVTNALAVVGPGGRIALEARETRLDGRPAVAFSVADDGPGFPPGSLDRIFDRFYRGDPARTGGGSGLGLAIVRELAEAHGGRAIAEQLAPHGARVTVVLPVEPRRA